MTSQTNILYPLALNAAGITIPVRDANHGGIYNCLGCDQIMIAKQGKFRVWHYAHKSQQANTCNPDLVLHRTAQELILAGFRKAVAQEGEYILGCLCTRCGSHIIKNAAQADATIDREVSAVPGTRADLVITRASGHKLIIEVVNTHNLSEATANKYSQSSIPVLKIRPVWLPQTYSPDTVASEPRHDELNLYQGALAYDSLNISPYLCDKCETMERHERLERHKRREAAKRFHERHQTQAKRLVSLTKVKTPPKFKLINLADLDQSLTPPTTEDPYLRSLERHRINTQAHQLADMGFEQSPTVPTTFQYANPRYGLQIRINLNQSPSLLKLTLSKGPTCRECVLKEFQHQLSALSIPTDPRLRSPNRAKRRNNDT